MVDSIGHVQVSLFLLWLFFYFSDNSDTDIEGGCDTHLLYPESFLEFLVDIKGYGFMSAMGSKHLEACPTLASADWWVSLAIAHKDKPSIWCIFRWIHELVRTVLDLFHTFD